MKKILLFSTLSPYPFWAGSEKYWFDFATDPNVAGRVTVHAVLGDSPVTREKGKELDAAGGKADLFPHFNVNFGRRNLYRFFDRVMSRSEPTLPWFDRILSEDCDMVWFCLSTSQQITEVSSGARHCEKLNIPYWLILQHSFEDFFLTDPTRRELAASIAQGARRFVFISERNRFSVERAISEELPNAFHSSNTLSPQTLDEALRVPAVASNAVARFFTLGRFSPESKGQHLLIEALSAERWRSRDWELEFIGMSDTGRDYVTAMASYFRLDPGRLRFVPFTEDVMSAIVRNDLLLMPSLAEGTPYAMIESMASGRAAVGTPVGGIPELITDGKTGWLARTTSVVDIDDALERAWQARSAWSEIGANARENIRSNYSQEQSHSRLVEAVEEDTQ